MKFDVQNTSEIMSCQGNLLSSLLLDKASSVVKNENWIFARQLSEPYCILLTVPIKTSREGTDEDRHTFVTGDVVEVAEGDLANLKGTVLSIDGNKITIMPKHDDLKVQSMKVSGFTVGVLSDKAASWILCFKIVMYIQLYMIQLTTFHPTSNPFECVFVIKNSYSN